MLSSWKYLRQPNCGKDTCNIKGEDTKGSIENTEEKGSWNSK